jgi:two-component system chemotaxis response regulator CheB
MKGQPQALPRDIIVIGGSEGSIGVIETILRDLPADLSAAVLIVIHTGPSSPMLMASILGRSASMPVTYARQGEIVREGRIYLAPPDRHLEIRAPGLLHLSDGPKVLFARPAVNRLFETAAAIYCSRVIGIVLSGGDSDGADGLRAITEAGGLTFIQDPEEAKVPSMPWEALQRDHPMALLKSGVIGKVLGRAVNR